MNQRIYKLQVWKDELGFAAAHFITMRGKCERLHGHNYRVTIEVSGTLSEDQYVVDFGILKHFMRELVKALDHRVLLAANNPKLHFSTEHGHVTVAYGEKRYLFPESEVVMLPIENTTAELLATYLCDQLAQRLHEHNETTIKTVGVWVSEGPGQQALAQINWDGTP